MRRPWPARAVPRTMRRVKGGLPPNARVSYFQLGTQRYAVFSHETSAASGATSLSSAEGEVVRLALGGLSNAEIARVRGTSTRTVRNQLTSAYEKLGVGSRSELASLSARKRGST
jgi:DNA-binding CsgD family transcriptional regulator